MVRMGHFGEFGLRAPFIYVSVSRDHFV